MPVPLRDTTESPVMPLKDKAARAAYNAAYRRRKPKSPEKVSYFGAKYRCTNPNVGAYRHYGARGIEFRFESFEQFLEHIGPKPDPTWDLDRIDNDGHYEPGNVRWVPHKINAQNRRDTLNITYQGRTQCLWEWCKELQVNYGIIQGQLYRAGKTFEEALEWYWKKYPQ